MVREHKYTTKHSQLGVGVNPSSSSGHKYLPQGLNVDKNL